MNLEYLTTEAGIVNVVYLHNDLDSEAITK